MFYLIVIYIAVTIITAIKNKLMYRKCTSIIFSLHVNFKNNVAHKNYDHIPEIKKILSNTQITYFNYPNSRITEKPYICKTVEILAQARSVYKYRLKHSWLWCIELIKKIHIFRWCFDKKHNIFISIILSIVECFVGYLITLELDTMGIGKKILTFLHEIPDSLRQFLDTYLNYIF